MAENNDSLSETVGFDCVAEIRNDSHEILP